MKYPICLNYSVKSKFDDQMEAVRNLGFQVFFIQWDGSKFILTDGAAVSEVVLENKYIFNKERYFHTKYFVDMFRSVKKTLELENFEYIYMRYMPLFINEEKLFRRLKLQGTKIVIEFPTYPFEREVTRNILRKGAGKIWKRNMRKIYNYIDCFTIIGEDIPERYQDVPVIEFENCINVGRIPLRKPNLVRDEVHLLGVASMATWHGYDRIIKGLEKYRGDFSVFFHLVGDEGDGSLEKWKKMTKTLNLTDRVFFHGAKYGNELNILFDSCDIAIGSLAFYRTNFSKGSPLKIREYMARGIPFVYGYEDVGLPNNLPFSMNVDNSNSAVNIEQIVQFALTMRNDSSIPQQMRKFAEEKMTWRLQFEKLFRALDANNSM